MKHSVTAAVFFGSSLMAPGLTIKDAAEVPKPPMAKKVARIETLHGEERRDDYFWLREKQNPEVVAYLNAENRYTDSVMKGTERLQEILYQEILGRIKETDLSVPYRKAGWFYYSRTEQSKQYPIFCRKKGSLDAPEQITLDLNELARGEKFMALGAYQVSDDGKLLAYTTDNTGFREYTLRVKDLETGRLLSESREKVSSAAWASNSQTLFYTVEDHAKRPYRLYRHRLGSAEPDALLYEETDEMFNLQVFRSRSRAFLFLGSGSHTADEWRLLPAEQPEGAWRLVVARSKEHEYEIDHRGELLYIRTNQGCRNFRVVTAPISEPRRENWKEIVPCREDVMVSGIDLFANHLVLREREDGLPRVRITDLQTGASHRVEFPEAVYAVFPENNPEFDTMAFRFNYQSPTTPPSIYDYDMKTQERKLLKRTEVLGGYDPSRYQTERRYAKAADGARIPISLVYKKGLEPNGKSPMLLMGYGSYGAPTFARFDSNRVSLLDRGFVYAIAHIRGGGEMGKRWHDAGRMMSKKNTFTDFVTAAETLIADGYSSADRLAIEGASAGGLLIGAVVNMRSNLFRAAILRVPFVDVINTMLDSSLPLTVGEFEEWGNPRIKAQFDYIKSYSPYDNIAAKAYPAMLVKTSFSDSQVMYWEPAKYVAKLRTMKTDSHPLVFKINMAGGHGGSSGRYDRLREAAFDFAFLLTQFGLEK